MVKGTGILNDGSNANYARPISFIMILIGATFVLCQSCPLLYWQAPPLSALETSVPVTGILTLQVIPILPNDGATLVVYPSTIEVKVTRGDFPVDGARVQFWMEGGPVDAAMHNAGLTYTDSSGTASLVLQDPNTLDAGHYLWYATALKPGLKGGSSPIRSFSVTASSQRGNSSSPAGSVSTDKADYYKAGKVILVKIRGSINNYHLGEPIILKVRSPSGVTSRLVTYGTYLGGFQDDLDVGLNPPVGLYEVTIYHRHNMVASCSFYIMS